MFNIRYNVLLSDWMDEYFQFLTKKYDMNMSSVIRTYLCMGILNHVERLYPEFESEIQSKAYAQFGKKTTQDKLTGEETYKLLSRVLFEARKAAEFRLAKERRKKSK